MQKKIDTRKKFGRICALVVVGMFVFGLYIPGALAYEVEDADSYQINIDHDGNSGSETFIVSHDPGGTELFRIQENGRVGIGITSPGATLHVRTSGTGRHIRVEREDQTPFPDGTYMDLISGGAFCAIDCVSTSVEVFQIQEDGTARLHIRKGGNVGIGTTSPDHQLHILSATSADSILKIDVTSAGYESGIRLAEADTDKWFISNDGDDSDKLKIASDGGLASETRFTIQQDGNVGIGTTSPNAKLDVRGSAIFNDGSGDYDFRIEGDNDENLLFVDAGNDRIGIGTTSPAAKLDIHPLASEVGIRIRAAASPTSNILRLDDSNTYPRWRVDQNWDMYIRNSVGSDVVKIGDDGDIYFCNGGNVGIGTTSPAAKLEVSGDAKISDSLDVDTGTLRVDNTNNRVGIGTTSPTAKTHIIQTDVADAFRVDDQASDDTPFLIDQSGNVGIGTTSPGTILDINGGPLRIQSSGTPSSGAGIEIEYDATSSKSEILSYDRDTSDYKDLEIRASKIILEEAGTDILTIDGGVVGIGTTSPTAKTHIIQIAASDAFRVDDEASDTSPFVIDQDGDVGIGTTSPETKLHVEGTITVDQKIMADDSGGLELATDEGTTRLFIQDDGDVSIESDLCVYEETDSTEAKLFVCGGLPLSNPKVMSGIYLGASGNGEAAAIKMIAESPWVAGDNPSTLVFYTTADLSSTPQERMRIDSSGNVGIGVTNPLAKLTVDGSAVLIGDIYTTGGAVVQESLHVALGDTYLVGIGTTTPSAKLDVTGDAKISESLNVDSGTLYVDNANDRVGIGTTSPTGKLDINGNDIRIRSPQTPASASASGNTGEICWDQDYIYVCVGTNTWKKAAISTW